jgi:hypothetical protein
MFTPRNSYKDDDCDSQNESCSNGNGSRADSTYPEHVWIVALIENKVGEAGSAVQPAFV